MSSLRISHQSRAIGEVKSGDNNRTEAAEGAASFATALGAAGFAPKRAAANPIGDLSGAAGDGATAPRKRAEAQGKADAAAALAAEGSLGVNAADLPVAATGDASGADATMIAPFPADVPAAGADARATARLLAPPPRPGETEAPAMPESSNLMPGTAAPDAFPDAASADLIDPVPRVPFAAATPTAPVALSSRPTAAGDDPAIANAMPAAASVAPEAAAASPSVAQITALPAPSPGPISANVGLVAALSGQRLPIQAGQPGEGGGADDRGDQRGRFAPTIAGADAGGAAGVAGFGATAQAAGPAAATTAASSPAPRQSGAASNIADQIAGPLMRLVSSGSREMVMRLHPPELGDLTVRIAVNGRDVTAWFGSPQPQVQAAISQGIGQLQTDLGSAGYNLGGAWVGADTAGTGQQGANPPLPPGAAPAPAASLGLSDDVASRPLASGMSIYV